MNERLMGKATDDLTPTEWRERYAMQWADKYRVKKPPGSLAGVIERHPELTVRGFETDASIERSGSTRAAGVAQLIEHERLAGFIAGWCHENIVPRCRQNSLANSEMLAKAYEATEGEFVPWGVVTAGALLAGFRMEQITNPKPFPTGATFAMHRLSIDRLYHATNAARWAS